MKPKVKPTKKGKTPLGAKKLEKKVTLHQTY